MDMDKKDRILRQKIETPIARVHDQPAGQQPQISDKPTDT